MTTPWEKWGPYVSERSWGTVREDYSENGDFWDYFPHDLAKSKVYRWGEDGIAGWCDRYQILVFAPAFWNTKDPILKERLFGLSPKQGKHGEDVKEYYFHVDGTPTHSYMKYLYKYPHGEFPYQKLIQESHLELIDIENRYFDIFIEYAKEDPEDICIKIEAWNRSEEAAPLHILPHLWFRNQWSWGESRLREPRISEHKKNGDFLCLVADDSTMLSPPNLTFDYHLKKRYLYAPKGGKILFTHNETASKDAFHRAVIHKQNALPQEGTKACLHYVFDKVPPHQSVSIHLRLTDREMDRPLENIPKILAKRKEEADQFYRGIHPKGATEEEKQLQRQALSGILWNKQIYLYDVSLWLKGDNPNIPPPASREKLRNNHWRHLNSMRILIMPDKWEYPFFCAWDHAFHSLTLGLVDIELAKEHLWLLLFDQFQHPNGQIPSYEIEFSDLNPPIQAWAALKLYEMDKKKDPEFLKRCFHKLLINFSWWVNKVDSSGYNVFEGGFLGLDNAPILDQSQNLQGKVKVQQSDGTGWMAMFCLNLMRIALELAKTNRVYESLATKFFQHYIYIANALKKRDDQNFEMWDEEDGFFYDVMVYPDGKFEKFRVRSLNGLIPLFAVEFLDEDELKQYPEFNRDFKWFIHNRQDLVHDYVMPFKNKRYILTLMSEDRLKRVLKYVWDPEEFRSDFGLRSLSKFHEKHPFIFEDIRVGYEPGLSLTKIKGGNVNWRGPIAVPTTYLLIETLVKLSEALENPAFKEMAAFFANGLISLFTRNKQERELPGENPYMFYDFFHGESGKGLGASQKTGWTALVANLIDEFRNKK